MFLTRLPLKNGLKYKKYCVMPRFGALNLIKSMFTCVKFSSLFFNLLCVFHSRPELDSHVDMYCARRLLCGVCRPADLPALSSVLSGRLAAQRASERSGGGEPATCAGPRQPQPAAARAVPGYEPEEDAIAASLARISVCSCDFCRPLVCEPAVGWLQKTSCPTATRPV